jgi:hypothetical protein
MKKLSLILMSLFTLLAAAAQKKIIKKNTGMSFCQAMQKIVSNASNNFIDIRNHTKKDFYDENKFVVADGWKATIPVPGAFTSYVYPYEDTLYYAY